MFKNGKNELKLVYDDNQYLNVFWTLVSKYQRIKTLLFITIIFGIGVLAFTYAKHVQLENLTKLKSESDSLLDSLLAANDSLVDRLEVIEIEKNTLDKVLTTKLKQTVSIKKVPLIDLTPKIREDYINRFAKTAKLEMKNFGVPASIILAQGLLESRVGTSSLAKSNKNHFGIKCFNKKCKTNNSNKHCSVKYDAIEKSNDRYVKYVSDWVSFREHSKFLQKDRYKNLYKLNKNDYVGWAKGLQKCGYATDKNYSKKLIQIIKRYKLYKYDS
jgi:flagellum-specific peptidoglycan hydrolase FlgJ